MEQVPESTFMDLQVELTWPGKQTVVGYTRELSDFGVIVACRFDPAQPPQGTILDARLTADIEGDDAPVIKTRVKETTPEGMELEFVLDDE